MNNTRFILLLLLCALSLALPASAQTNSARGELLFRNGDRLVGELESILPTNGIRWRHPDALGPADFEPSAIAEIQMPNAAHPPVTSTNHCVLHLNNQDALEGDLVSFDGQKLVLNTWYAGTLQIPRGSLRSLIPMGPPKPPIYEGPNGLEDWTMGKVNAAALQGIESGEWSYRNGAFYATRSASIARDMKLPDVASLQFDLAWNGFFHLAIALYTSHLQPVNLGMKDTEPDFGGFYSLQFNTYYANLIPIKKLDPLRYLGQASLQNLSQRNVAHLDIRVNKPKQTIALLVDGVLIKEWVDTEGFAGTGTAIRFVHQGQGSVRVNHIKISEWDGQYEEKNVSGPAPQQDLARLRNGDRVTGKLEEVREGKLMMAGSEPRLVIPIPRVKALEFAQAPPAGQPTGTNSVRAFFPNGGSFRFQLEKWTTNEIVATTPDMGRLTVKPSAFSKLVFE